MKFCILILSIIAISCSKSIDQELIILSEIVNSQSDEIKTSEVLIPLKMDVSKTFDDYILAMKIRKGEIPTPKKTGNEIIPEPPSMVRNEYVIIGSVLFDRLLINNQLSKEEFSEIRKIVESNNTKSRKMDFDNFTKISLEEFHKGGTDTKRFREYGYPILIGNKLILYSNNYFYDNHFSHGEGKFEVYEKKEGQWIKINTITKWIS